MADQTGHSILLSAQPASRSQQRIALSATLLLLFFFIATLPFAWVQGPAVPALILTLHTIIGINDLITSALLFGQYSLDRAQGLNILAGGYLFTSLVSIPYLLSFPGVISEPALVSGDRSAPWLYVAWHGGLSVAIIVYACLPSRVGQWGLANGARASIVRTGLGALGAVVVFALAATAGRDWLPAVAVGSGRQYSTTILVAIGGLAALSLVALLLLARRRPYKILDLWLMVVMCAWLCSIILGAAIGTLRYDIGYDVSRVFAALASTFVLVLLLSEMNALYGRAIVDRERRLKEMEAVLIHLSRVSELGQNVSSLIHEVNQPLTAISNYVAACLQLITASRPERLKQILERSAQQVTRAIEIIQHLRDFITRRESEKRIENVPEMLHRAVELACVGYKPDFVSIQFQCADGAAAAFCDRVQIEQVVFNLVRNATEAMAHSNRRALTISSMLNSANMVELHIADTGPGISPEIRARLFEPFLTTKTGGLGIGLSICRVIVEAHNGRLDAYDNPGGGAVFRFTLPPAP